MSGRLNIGCLINALGINDVFGFIRCRRIKCIDHITTTTATNTYVQKELSEVKFAEIN